MREKKAIAVYVIQVAIRVQPAPLDRQDFRVARELQVQADLLVLVWKVRLGRPVHLALPELLLEALFYRQVVLS